MHMNEKELLDELRENYQGLRFSFNQEEVKFQCLRNYRQGKLHGLFTRAYWKRKELFQKGQIAYGYVFKEYRPQIDDLYSDYPIWVLLSPNHEFETSPDKYLIIVDRLNQFLKQKAHSRKDKQLQRILEGELSEVYYYILPSYLTEGALVYLCTTYVRHTHTPLFHLGLNPILYAPTISKEIMILPNKYWTKAWNNYYQEEHKDD